MVDTLSSSVVDFDLRFVRYIWRHPQDSPPGFVELRGVAALHYLALFGREARVRLI